MTRPYMAGGARSRKRWLWAVGLVVLACGGGVATIFWAVARPLPDVKATALEILMGPCDDADRSTSEKTSLAQDLERLRLIEAQVRRSPAVRLDLRDVALYDGVEYAFWFSAQASDRIRTEWNARAAVSAGSALTAAPAADWCYLIDVHHRLHYIGSVVAETDTAWFSGHPSSLDLVLNDHAVDGTSHVVGGLYLYTFYGLCFPTSPCRATTLRFGN